MRVVMGNRTADLEDRDLLGVGGEARVYRCGDRAVKIFHPIDPSLARAPRKRAQADLDQKLEKVRRFPSGAWPHVVAPLELVADPSGSPIGYSMRAVDGARDVACLSRRGWREGVVTNAAVTALFVQLHTDLSELHRRRIVVGDLNDGNVVFTWDAPTGRAEGFWIDADSMQFDQFPCVVGHERFLDPRLYGRDLASGPVFTEESDWYAFSVMLFASLLYVHPYGGIHPSLGTLLRRAEARVSVLADGVTLPRAATTPRVLPDGLLAHLFDVFDRDRRGPFPEALLAIRWTLCGCGLEHARPRCPECDRTGAAIAVVTVLGRCRARRVVATRGRVVRAAVQGALRWVVAEEGELRREDGTVVGVDEPGRPVRCWIEGEATWIGRGGSLERVAPGRDPERTATATFGMTPAFDANRSRAFRIDDGWLIETGRQTRVGPVLDRQTWFSAGEKLGIGFYRAGLVTVYFLFRTDRAGFIHPRLPGIVGKLVDAHAVFDDRHALLAIATEKDGRTTHALHLVGEDGKRIGSASGSPDGERILASLRGKALMGGRVVTTTDDGLVTLALDPSGRLVEGRLFPDTKPFVDGSADLLPGPGGSVYVITAKEIVSLSLT